MSPMYEFACESGHKTERYFTLANGCQWIQCPQCHTHAHKVFSIPTVRTLEEYVDENLADEGSPDPFVVTSHPQKQRRLRELGLDERGPTDSVRDRRKKGSMYSLP